MSRHYFFIIVICAIVCLFLIFFSLWKEIESPVTKAPTTPPPNTPYASSIAGVGIVEASSSNIMITTPLSRVVDKVLVNVGTKVKKGDILFCLEDRDLKASLEAQMAVYNSTLANLQKLKALPRKEDLTAAEAVAKIAEAEFDLAKNQYEMVLALSDPRAISQEEKNRRFFNYLQAEAKKDQAQADLKKVQEGAWKPDLEIAHFEVLKAESNVNQIKTEILRTIVRSPINGTVLQIKTHAGEFPDTRTPMMILGNTEELYLRVSINQLDIPFYHAHSDAVAFLQGDAKVEFPLEFVRIEPYLVNKQNLTNEITEKVDTRVLQILYRIKKSDQRLFVGQQMDVFIATESSR